MDEEEQSDERFLEAFKQISLKINKKQFIFNRKATFEEANAELIKWTETLKREGNRPYSAFCALAASRCQQALGNNSKEAALCQEAGLLFWEEQIDWEAVCSIQTDENTCQAIDAYSCAIDIYLKQGKTILAASLYYEMASMLHKLYNYAEAAFYYLKAAELQHKASPMAAVLSYKSAAHCFIRQRDYAQAHEVLKKTLKVANTGADPQALDDVDIAESLLPTEQVVEDKRPQGLVMSPFPMSSFFTQVMIEVRVIIILLDTLQGRYEKASYRLREFWGRNQQETSWDKAEEELPLCEPSLFASLQSLIQIHRARDEGLVEEIKQELCPLLTPFQWEFRETTESFEISIQSYLDQFRRRSSRCSLLRALSQLSSTTTIMPKEYKALPSSVPPKVSTICDTRKAKDKIEYKVLVESWLSEEELRRSFPQLLKEYKGNARSHRLEKRNANKKQKESDRGGKGTTFIGECVVCMEKPAAVAFMPCGHVACCAGCKMATCPICRTQVTSAVSVYFPVVEHLQLQPRQAAS